MGGAAAETQARSDDLNAWASTSLDLLASLSGVARVGLAVAEGGGRRLLFTASDRRRESELIWCEVDAYQDVPLNQTLRDGSSIVSPSLDLEPRWADFAAAQRDAGFEGFASIAISSNGSVLGGFVLYLAGQQRFTARQVDELVKLGAELGRRLHAIRGGPRKRREFDTPPAGSLVAGRGFPPDVSAVADARRFMSATLADWGIRPEVSDEVVLCLSEVVTNALIHTVGGCDVRVVLDRGVLTTQVRDDGGALFTAPMPADALETRGRGVELVRNLASRSGLDQDDHGGCAWFSFDLRGAQIAQPGQQRSSPSEGPAAP